MCFAHEKMCPVTLKILHVVSQCIHCYSGSNTVGTCSISLKLLVQVRFKGVWECSNMQLAGSTRRDIYIYTGKFRPNSFTITVIDSVPHFGIFAGALICWERALSKTVCPHKKQWQIWGAEAPPFKIVQ